MVPRTGIHVEDSETSLRLSWDNRSIRKDRLLGCVLVPFWLVWAPVTVFVTTIALAAEWPALVFLVVWLVFGWLGTIGIPYSLAMRRWRESLTIDRAAITLNYSGFLARKPRIIPLDQIVEISIGQFGQVSRDDRESVVTLNIMRSKAVPFWSRREMVGYWLAKDHKEQLFQAIEAFVDVHHLPVRMTRCD